MFEIYVVFVCMGVYMCLQLHITTVYIILIFGAYPLKVIGVSIYSQSTVTVGGFL